MQLCFQSAVDRGFSIAVTPHLDDGHGDKAWRNGLVFDPTQRYGDFSYVRVMLEPLAEALALLELRRDTKIWFAMQGEGARLS